jgi:PAS domain S-box-containing protein
MNPDLLLQIIYNSAVLLTISLIYEISFSDTGKSKLHNLASGAILGLIGIIIMSIPFELQEGIIFDTRSILVGLTAFYFGIPTTLIAAAMMAGYRFFIGGAAALTGILVISLSAVLGTLWKKYFSPKSSDFDWKNAFAFGLALHIGMLLCMLTLPWETAAAVLRAITLPVMIIYPITTVLLSRLIHDQKQQKSSIALIKEAEEKYKSLFNNHHTVMMIVDPESGRIIDANPAAEAYYGWRIETLKTMNVSDLNTLSMEEIKLQMEKAKSKKQNSFIFKHRKASGDLADVEVFSGAIQIQGRTLLYSIVHDIGDRLRAEAELTDSVERFKLLVENSPDAIFIQTHGCFTYVNKATLKLYGAKTPDELIGRQVIDLVHEDHREAVKQRIHELNVLQRAVPMREEVLLKLDGTLAQTEIASVPVKYNNTIGAIVFARDISERKAHEMKRMEIESQLRQQQKLEAIGTLAGGVAHEINNPINGIINYAQLISEEMETLSVPTEYAKEIIHESKRISDIVRNLLQFSRYEKQSHSYASPYDIINHTASLIKTVIRKDQIKFYIELDEHMPDLKCRSQQIQQVIMNMLTNARDALNEKYPGFHEDKIMRLTCRQNDHDGRRWLRLTVEDHGSGIPQEVQSKIFEPFFSTKPKDIGTGLGLSISYGIVKEHHGDLSFDTEQGKMTRFVLDLPVDNGWNIHAKEQENE